MSILLTFYLHGLVEKKQSFFEITLFTCHITHMFPCSRCLGEYRVGILKSYVQHFLLFNMMVVLSDRGLCGMLRIFSRYICFAKVK